MVIVAQPNPNRTPNPNPDPNLTRFSWHNRTLVSSGYGRSLPQAMRLAQEPWRNCSPTGGGWTWTGWAYREAEAEADAAGERDFCHGPLAFARGSLTPLSPLTY